MSQIFILFPLFAALCAGLIFAVLYKSKASKTQALGISFIISAAAMGGYLWMGNPGVPGAAALFERSGPNFERRQMALKERDILTSMAEKGTASPLSMYLELADTQIEQGKTEQAIITLKQAVLQFPENEVAQKSIKNMMGYAYYIQGLTFKIDGERKKAVKAFESALDLMPEGAEYRDDLQEDLKRLK